MIYLNQLTSSKQLTKQKWENKEKNELAGVK